ncbi:anti-sigma-factor antagonist and sugar transfersase [Leptolyngbya sp. Heron Island J]|uniref:sugar transferase n=1 Tax=Leptolyngbya sp. Heron Island J TaxID=1385935 RepID=UPI0003B9B3DE|nr:sugar transferase [Leptolyngbya sp. Heron Island J]ESA35133.1 anti-sigma-factor antagonist and sugar transfersase [Leptolyngbya sp. Heron Island J]
MVDSVKTSSPISAVVPSKVQTIHLPVSVAVVEATAFKKQCQTLFAERPDLSELVLDFSATRFIDSSGIGALVICHRLSAAKSCKLRLINVPPQVMMVLSLTELDKVFDITLAAAAEAKPEDQVLPETHPSVNSKAKRALDILGGLVGLFLTALVYVPVAIIIKFDDGGPVFFAQTRCSWLGKRFQIWKFRSMVTDAEARKNEVANQVEGPLFKNENDPRITKIGRFLRKTSLDEFPQFWNVLKGDMSLVGTRPPTPDEIEQYEVGQWQRLNVKPGMTGEWQVNGRSSITKFEDVIKLDLRYQENWSFFYDIKLIVRTVLVLFSKESGAH